MNVAYFLVPKSQVSWVSDAATLDETVALMLRCGHATLPVVDAAGSYLGTISEAALLASILRAELEHRAGPYDAMVAALPIDRATPVIGIGCSIESVLLRIVDHSFLPVVDGRGAFIGILRRRDVIAHFAALLVPSVARQPDRLTH